MRKRIAEKYVATPVADSEAGWLDLAEIATEKISSEDPRFPIESSFAAIGPGWGAGDTGEQEVRLIFDEPISVRGIQLRSEEVATERTQEFTLSWSSARGGASTEIIRQQWTFTPQGSTAEVEDYSVDL
jgi:hypothetical protein